MKKKIALLSVYHKDGITEFTQNLIDLGFEILASGGTARHLVAAGLEAKDVASLVGGESILGHRVVTLSREVHAGLLAKRVDVDIQEMEKLGLPFIDLVCVDLYPLQAEINRPGSDLASVIEQTDIGGPTMLRSAAKGRRITVCDPVDRQRVIDWLKDGLPDEDEFLNELAAKAEYIVAEYCLISARYHSQGAYNGWIGKRVLTCKYGENGYQAPAALYKLASNNDPLALHRFEIVAGDSPSYNNLCDLDRLLQTVTHIAATFHKNCSGNIPSIAVGVKHGNACGAAIDFDDQKVALTKMLLGDPVSLFGGLIMLNFPVTEEIADIILFGETDAKRLLDGIIAPWFSDQAIEILSRKKGKCRLLANMELTDLQNSLDGASISRSVRGGSLEQPNYSFIFDLKSRDLMTYSCFPSPIETFDFLLAKAICDTSNSNTMTLVKERQLIGNGVGQQSRARACRFAIAIAQECNHDTRGAIAASDSFFPFVDGPEVLQQAGIKGIVTTSGSIRDQEIIEFCRKKNIGLFMIPDAIARGFFKH